MTPEETDDYCSRVDREIGDDPDKPNMLASALAALIVSVLLLAANALALFLISR